MKTRISIFLLIFCLFTNCNNDDDSPQIEFESTGKITGYDSGACFCCGGFYIEIDGVEDNKSTYFPENFDIDLQNLTFPIYLQLNWSNALCTKRIIIDQMELIE
ncbi:hypothetical protein FBALC1_14007 [Flavobacteriales bacterium ALC-1]|nr:hypothetical protein FBALC1_14007 [Flavobacteriales bacterium ALC-1]